MARVVVALAALVGAASAIYPDDHWDHSTRLTNDVIVCPLTNTPDLSLSI